jgi:hypothetical protein
MRLLLCLLIAAPPLQGAPAQTNPLTAVPAPVSASAAVQTPTVDEAVAAICKQAPSLCDETTQVVAAGRDLGKQAQDCAASSCDLKTIDSLNVSEDELTRRYFLIKDKERGKVNAISIFSLIYDSDALLKKESERLIPPELTGLETEFKDLQVRTAGLQSAVRAKTSDPASMVSGAGRLSQDGDKTLGRFTADSLSIDRRASNCKVDDADIAAWRERANAVAVGLSTVRERLIALQQSLKMTPAAHLDLSGLLKGAASGIKEIPHASQPIGGSLQLNKITGFSQGQVDPLTGKPGLDPSAIKPDVLAAAVKAAAQAQAVINAQPARTFLDSPRLPPPTLSGFVAQPTIAFDGTWNPKIVGTKTPEEAVAKQTMSQSDMKAVLELRRKGQTAVVGSPQSRASLIHPQSEDDCAVVAQQQILVQAGVLSNADPVGTENALIKFAKDHHLYNNGTPAAYRGDLLVAHNMLITKQYNAKPADLDTAVKTGKMIQVAVDAGVLWNDPSESGGHAVVITGAEVSKVDGKVLGYYINDSGSYPAVGGRLVPAAQLLKAWRMMGNAMVVPQ